MSRHSGTKVSRPPSHVDQYAVGLLPVEDSRIYKLLFRVVHECEQYFKRNTNYVQCAEMSQAERCDLMQQKLERLRTFSRKSSVISGARQ